MQVQCVLLVQVLLLLVASPPTIQQASKKQQNVADQEGFPLDCDDVYDQGEDTDGVYLIYPSGPGTPVPVYCDMTTDGGKWTVFQKRFNGTITFFRNWNEYKLGFGRADGEYWLGLHNLYLLTLKQKYELRVDLADFENSTASATYTDFAISPHAINAEEDGYALYVDGFVDGGAGDALSYHSGMKFSTIDRDQDLFAQNCAGLTFGAFWFKTCHYANLNGLYLQRAQQSYASGINWYPWKSLSYSLKETEMKIRRV
ncbi:microfibril-associated glycoprotein 4-like isoform X2 [Ambystoma mexicanum]|uniref:microfibril-associated glycoprotein 4-like isoform X2 n=1 Tax=Ambystoma mexicanum TaxID=8296 RepID=UPI0037E71A3E